MALAAKSRTPWVWAALIFQAALFAFGLWSNIALLVAWPRYASHGAQLLPYLVRSLAETAFLGVSLIGLWRSKRWGWTLALAVDGFMCAVDLNALVANPFLIKRYSRIFIFQAWDYAGLALLLHQPVRRFFATEKVAAKVPAPQFLQPARKVGWPQRSLRITAFFALAVIVTCALTAFSLTLLLGEKAGGGKGFLLLLWIAFMIGGISALLFTALLTVLARRMGPDRLWLWILLGGLLAPGMILGLGAGAYFTHAPGILGYIFGGPVYLFEVWWLGIPIGIVTAFTCYQMYPWGFKRA